MELLPAIGRWIPLAWVSGSQFSAPAREVNVTIVLAASLQRSTVVCRLTAALATPEVVLFAMLSGPFAKYLTVGWLAWTGVDMWQMILFVCFVSVAACS